MEDTDVCMYVCLCVCTYVCMRTSSNSITVPLSRLYCHSMETGVFQIIKMVEEWKTNLMSLAILFHFLCAQPVSDINISIFRSLRLCWWITTSVILFSVRCVLELWCCWFWVVFVLQAAACKMNTTQNQPHQIFNTQRTENKMTDVVIHQHSRKLLKMDILMSKTCWAHNKWNKIASDVKLVFHSSTVYVIRPFIATCNKRPPLIPILSPFNYV